MTTKVYDTSLRSLACERLLQSRGADEFGRVFILPIPTSRDGIYITGSNITVSSVTEDCRPSDLVLGYDIPNEEKMKMRRRGAVVADSLFDEEFLEENAEITAAGVVGVILTSEKKIPRDMKIGVVGYGRIGKILVRELLYMGADIMVYTRRENIRLELAECGISSLPCGDSSLLEGLDMLINTAPSRQFFGVFPEGLRVLELAPGDNFPDAEIYEKYPSLPARMFPISAGRAWYNSVARFLEGGCAFSAEVTNE